jgi:hypothetical protein
VKLEKGGGSEGGDRREEVEGSGGRLDVVFVGYGRKSSGEGFLTNFKVMFSYCDGVSQQCILQSSWDG